MVEHNLLFLGVELVVVLLAPQRAEQGLEVHLLEVRRTEDLNLLVQQRENGKLVADHSQRDIAPAGAVVLLVQGSAGGAQNRLVHNNVLFHCPRHRDGAELMGMESLAGRTLHGSAALRRHEALTGRTRPACCQAGHGHSDEFDSLEYLKVRF